MQERIIDFVVRNSQADSEALRKLMTATTDMTTDIGTVIDGEEAVKYGIIDRVGGLGDAVAELKSMIKKEQNR